MTTLTAWSICRLDGDAYLAPELGSYALHGIVANHPKKLDGTRVQTSRIISAEGREVVTENTRYTLIGDPNPEWLTWLSDNGFTFDPESPAQPKRAEVGQ